MRVEFELNGQTVEVNADPCLSLLDLLRDELGHYGSKNACTQGECGSCSVFVDGSLACSCLVLTGQLEGTRVMTIEGLRNQQPKHPVLEAFVDAGAVQCGFCTPGLVMATIDLLDRMPDPSEDQIREALSGNLCRCTGYEKILDAVRSAAGRE